MRVRDQRLRFTLALPPRALFCVERCAAAFFFPDFVERFAALAPVPRDFALPRRSSAVAAGVLLRRARVLRADPRAPSTDFFFDFAM